MARTAAVATSLPRPVLLTSVGLLTRVIPLSVVSQVLTAQGRQSQRERALPAPFVVYLVVALSLYLPCSLREVLRCVLEGLRALDGGVRIATKAAISGARTRLGWEVLAAIFAQVVRPLATPETAGAWYRGWRIMIVDGTSLALQDTPKNAQEFGRPNSKHGEGAYPLVRLVGLVEAGTRAVVAAAFGPWKTPELTLAEAVLPSVASDMLLLEDRGYVGYGWWKAVAATGAQVLCRVRKNMRFACQQRLPDGSFRSVLRPPKGDPGEPIPVRVIAYHLPEVPGAEARYCVLTSLLDPATAPAEELAALYHERWEAETLFDEFKTHLRGGSRVLLRSKTPELVRQEVYGLLLAHYCVRTVMYEAAQAKGEDPDRISFLHTVRVLRRKLPQAAGVFSP
jgi:Insertion element 4 transposase N-terminal/Transposase DDE domain